MDHNLSSIQVLMRMQIINQKILLFRVMKKSFNSVRKIYEEFEICHRFIETIPQLLQNFFEV